MDQAVERKVAIEAKITALLANWSLGPVVTALQALRGVALATRSTGGRKGGATVGRVVPCRHSSVMITIPRGSGLFSGLSASKRPEWFLPVLMLRFGGVGRCPLSH